MDTAFEGYRKKISDELDALLRWWKSYAVDQEQGGFYGAIRNDNQAITDASKGLVLNSRILWTFAAAYRLNRHPDDLQMAHRAFYYLNTAFYDPKYGGFYWSLTATCSKADGKKQIYGQAFAIYGLTEYYKATADVQALERAKATFRLIEKYSYDPEYDGYTEAFAEDWSALSDLRLSEKDQNAVKSMNTHLHVIEAYASLYQVWPDEQLSRALQGLLQVFKTHIIGAGFHQALFFSQQWETQSSLISFGHDIEAAWLLQECAESLGKEEEIQDFREIAVAMADAVLQGVDEDGGMFYEYDRAAQHLVREKHWWPQAEALVGFFNAWQLSGEEKFLQQAWKSWSFVENSLKDRTNGEWYWGVYPDGSLMPENKAGFWKCPYHNARACIELLKRINTYFEKAF